MLWFRMTLSLLSDIGPSLERYGCLGDNVLESFLSWGVQLTTKRMLLVNMLYREGTSGSLERTVYSHLICALELRFG